MGAYVSGDGLATSVWGCTSGSGSTACPRRLGQGLRSWFGGYVGIGHFLTGATASSPLPNTTLLATLTPTADFPRGPSALWVCQVASPDGSSSIAPAKAWQSCGAKLGSWSHYAGWWHGRSRKRSLVPCVMPMPSSGWEESRPPPPGRAHPEQGSLASQYLTIEGQWNLCFLGLGGRPSTDARSLQCIRLGRAKLRLPRTCAQAKRVTRGRIQ